MDSGRFTPKNFLGLCGGSPNGLSGSVDPEKS